MEGILPVASMETPEMGEFGTTLMVKKERQKPRKVVSKAGSFRKTVAVELMKMKQLTAEDVKCPICWSVLYEPTTLPCKHSLCMACFLKHVDETSLYCPLCRCRLSVWSRKVKKQNEFLDEELWSRLKTEFADLIAARETGEDTEVLIDQPKVRDGVFCEESGQPGVLFDELKKILKPHEDDLAIQRLEDETGSTPKGRIP